MSQNLPAGDFKWVKKHLNLIKILLKTNEDSSAGCFLEVDKQYLRKLHETHCD